MAERPVTCSRCGQTMKHPLETCGHCGYAQLDRLTREFQRSLAAGVLCFGSGVALFCVRIDEQVSWPFLGLILALAAFGAYWFYQALVWLKRLKTAAKINLSATADARTITPVSREAVDMFDGTVGLGEAVRLLQNFFELIGFAIEEEPVTNGMLFSGSKEFGEADRPGLARYEIKVVVRSVRLRPVSVQAAIRETYVPIWDGYYARYRHYCMPGWVFYADCLPLLTCRRTFLTSGGWILPGRNACVTLPTQATPILGSWPRRTGTNWSAAAVVVTSFWRECGTATTVGTRSRKGSTGRFFLPVILSGFGV